MLLLCYINVEYRLFKEVMMKKLLCLGVVVLFSFSFGRVSSYYAVVVSPVESYIQKKQLEVSSIEGVGDSSIKWKRRHKRRRKTRRPQRGR